MGSNGSRASESKGDSSEECRRLLDMTDWSLSEGRIDQDFARVDRMAAAREGAGPYRSGQVNADHWIVVVRLRSEYRNDVSIAIAVWRRSSDQQLEQMLGVEATDEANPVDQAKWWLGCWLRNLRRVGLTADASVEWYLDTRRKACEALTPTPGQWARELLDSTEGPGAAAKGSSVHRDLAAVNGELLVAEVVDRVFRGALGAGAAQPAVGAPPPAISKQQAAQLAALGARLLYDEAPSLIAPGKARRVLTGLTGILKKLVLLLLIPVAFMNAFLVAIPAMILLLLPFLFMFDPKNAHSVLEMSVAPEMHVWAGVMFAFAAVVSVLAAVRAGLSKWKHARYAVSREPLDLWRDRFAGIVQRDADPTVGAALVPVDCRRPRGVVLLELLGGSSLGIRLQLWDMSRTTVDRLAERAEDRNSSDPTPADRLPELMWVSRVVRLGKGGKVGGNRAELPAGLFSQLVFKGFGVSEEQMVQLRDSGSVQWFVVGGPSTLAREITGLVRSEGNSDCSNCRPVDKGLAAALRSLEATVSNTGSAVTTSTPLWQLLAEIARRPALEAMWLALYGAIVLTAHSPLRNYTIALLILNLLMIAMQARAALLYFFLYWGCWWKNEASDCAFLNECWEWKLAESWLGRYRRPL